MEPHEHTDVEKTIANSSIKDNGEILSDDSPSEESRRDSNQGGKEPEPNQTNFSLSNLRQPKKSTLLDSANTKDVNDPKQNDGKIGFGLSEKLKRDYADPLKNATDFFNGSNPYSLDPVSQSEIRCQDLYQDPSVPQSIANLYVGSVTASVATVSALTGQTTLLRAGIQAAKTGGDILEIAMSTTPAGLAIDLAMGVGVVTKELYDQHQSDIEKASGDRIRCERDFLKDYIKNNLNK